MTDLQVKLHEGQLKIFNDPTRFKVVAAGRRFGKSRLAAWLLIIKALQSQNKDVFYVAPTFQQAKDIMWSLLKEIGHEVIAAAHENTAVLTLINGRKIYLKGSDRPDTLRGVGLAYAVLDEFADMKPATWEQIIRPALADVKGGALFIGTPKGRNAFYEMYKYGQSGKDKDWTSFHFTSLDNPLIPPEEVEAARMSMSSFAFKQEFMAAFEAASSDLFKEEWVIIEEKEPKEGSYYIAIDLAGFEDVASQAMNKKKLLDETAIAVVKVTDEGNWYVKELIHGRWDIKETANEILKAVSKYEPNAVGIEKGSLKNAVMPYLTDLMRKYNKYFRIDEVTHGNRKKIDRVVWSLQGRFEHGRITLCEGLWNNEFIDQLLNFPNPQMHDDLVDALAYVDQVAVVTYADARDFEDSWEPLDAITGY
jgi:predicted phage terminase large subunit-like protein